MLFEKLGNGNRTLTLHKHLMNEGLTRHPGPRSHYYHSLSNFTCLSRTDPNANSACPLGNPSPQDGCPQPGA